MKYNKLVRDNIPEHIRKNGDAPSYHVANEQEYWEKLKEKLHEEIKEFEADESIDEFADVLEVVDAIAAYKKFDRKTVEDIRNNKATEKGRFEDRIILDEA